MKIVFNKQQMANAVAPLMCAVSGKSTLTAVEGILIEAIKPDTCILTTYDLEKGMRIKTNAEVIEEGCFILNAQKFNQTLKVMGNDMLTLTVSEDCHATIEFGKSVHQMNALKGSDFPTIPKLEAPQYFSVKQGIFKEMMEKVGYAMALNDQRNVLNGCFFKIEDERVMSVACDTFRLAKCIKETKVEKLSLSSSIDKSFMFIIPNKSVHELTRMLDDSDDYIKIYFTHKNLVFCFDEYTFFTRTVDGFYIDYERVLVKDHEITVKVDREKLISALERASLITEERIAGALRANVKFNIEGGLLKIMANSSAGSTYDELEVEHEGGDILIAFNNRYLLDCFRACGGDKVIISLSTPLTSINVVPAEGDDGYIEESMLLPVRMS